MAHPISNKMNDQLWCSYTARRIIEGTVRGTRRVPYKLERWQECSCSRDREGARNVMGRNNKKIQIDREMTLTVDVLNSGVTLKLSSDGEDIEDIELDPGDQLVLDLLPPGSVKNGPTPKIRGTYGNSGGIERSFEGGVAAKVVDGKHENDW